MPLKPGVARLAAKTGATIVPVWLDGTYDVWPRDKKLPTFFKKIHIHFLDPIDTNNQENPESKKLEEMQLMEEIKTALETKKRKLHEKTADN